ncbi:tyrosine-type recombinase/integrase [Anaerosporobacter faecicola]|uniref:tyrosine-type recombinase/integrase n=1 Tax=Anaerosporobacter faecicola TaxID=2718714 RepID=UPI00143A1B4B|nr:site-specific integrase [Anaerosporobacter faecicola]
MKSRRVDTGIVQRGKSYTFTVAMGMTTEGKQIRKTTTFTPPEGTTEKKADKLAKEEYINFKNRCKGLSAFNENMRFKELSEEYFKVYAPNRLKPITAYNYEKMVAYHFNDYFGNKKLKEITSGMLTNFFGTHTSPNRNGVNMPLSPSNAKKLYTILQSIFTFAVTQDYIKESPARNVILPSKKATQDETRKYLTESELTTFLSMFQEYSPLNTIIKVLLFTGMRSGECLGLQWEDINFTDKIITIRHTLSDVGGKHFLTTPKSKNSRRSIAMSDSVVDLLKEHKKHQLELQIALSNTFVHPEMVFTSDTGNYKDRSCLNTSFRNKIKNTEFDFLTLHSLRHCNATLLLNSGVDIKIVSDHLGHSDIGVTADIYADVLETTRKKTAEIIELKLAK